MSDDEESDPPRAAESEETSWSATIKKITLEEFALRFEDRRPRIPVPFHIEGLGLHVQHVTTDMSRPIALELGFTFNQSGQLAVHGQVTPEPPAGDLKLDLAGFAFTHFQPYLEPFVQFQLERGALSVKGHATFQAEEEKDAMVRFAGDVTIDDFVLVDAAASEEFLKWEQLAVQGMIADFQPTRMDLRELVVTLPYTKVVHSEDGILNVSRLFSPPRSQPSEPDGGNTALEAEEEEGQEFSSDGEDVAVAPHITIDTVRINNAAIDFTDQAIDPNVVTGIQNFTGTIQGLSSKELSKADVSIEGRVDNVATLKIQGQINPFISISSRWAMRRTVLMRHPCRFPWRWLY